MPNLYKYTFTCSTESVVKEVWREEDDPIPSKCPDDTAHTIDSNTIRIAEVLKDNLMKVQEETTPTGGHFKCLSRHMAIGANETKIQDEIFPFDINALAIEFNVDAENQNDNLDLIVGPDTVVGAITADVAITDNVITVGDTVIDNIAIGYKANLFDGVNTEELGYVTAIDKDNKTITTENNSTQAFTATTPTYVRINVYIMEKDDYTIGKPYTYEIGGNKIGASYIPKNTIVRIIYYNNENIAKDFYAQLEYMY